MHKQGEKEVRERPGCQHCRLKVLSECSAAWLIGLPVVLYGVLAAMRQELGDYGPLVAHFGVAPCDDVLLPVLPGLLDNVWPQVILRGRPQHSLAGSGACREARKSPGQHIPAVHDPGVLPAVLCSAE